MPFKPSNTSNAETSLRKILIFANAGYGKTTQAKYFQEAYGPGFIISCEGGLSSVREAGIDYMNVTSFDGVDDEAAGEYSFTSVARAISSQEFKDMNYQWLMLDSLTELSDLILDWSTVQAENEAKNTGKAVNGFAKYVEHNDKLIGAMKWFRNLPYNIIVTALAKEVENENAEREVRPSVNGAKAQTQIAGIFDIVLGGIRRNVKNEETGKAEVKRYLVTDVYAGYQCKARDENRVLSAVEKTSNIVDILTKLDQHKPTE